MSSALLAAACRALAVVVLTLGFAGAITFVLVDERAAFAADVNHPSLATENPDRGTPVVTEGIVYSTVQFADRIIVAGDFDQVETFRGGPVVNRSNIFAYDINSGQIIDDFAPVVNGRIRDLVVDDSGHAVYLGGTFTQIDGEFNIRVAKLDYFGNVDPAFRPDVSAEVLAMDVSDGVLYVGGSFTTVNGEPHDRIAAVDTALGNSIASFNFQITGSLGRVNNRSVKALDITSDGGRMLVAFNGRSIVDNDGVSHDRYGIAFINLTRNNVTQYRTAWYENAHTRCAAQALQLRDAELSPDDSFFVVVEKGGTNCDKAVAFPGTSDGSLVENLWVTAAHDSVFSVGVSNNAVYIGGHFCFLRDFGAVSAAESLTQDWENKPELCDIGGGTNSDQGVFDARQQIAALDIDTGAALAWNPTSNALVAVFDIEPIDRGLLIGQDADRVNSIRTGSQAFLDFGGTTPPYVPPAPDMCNASVDANGVVSVAWDQIDGAGSYVVRRNDSYVATTNGLTFSESPAVGVYEYVIRYRINGAVVDLECSPNITVDAPAFNCTAIFNANLNAVVIRWTDQPGVSSYSVRRDGRWIATSEALVYQDRELAPGTYSYEVRYRSGGQTVTVPCSPATIAVAGQTLSCTANNQGTVSWNAIDGVSSYQVRKNGNWLATSGGQVFSDPTGTAGDEYEIRFRQAGQVVTVACG